MIREPTIVSQLVGSFSNKYKFKKLTFHNIYLSYSKTSIIAVSLIDTIS